MGSHCEVFDAEARALNLGFKAAVQFIKQHREISRIFVFIDNASVVQLAMTSPVCSSQDQFLQFESDASQWLESSTSNRLRLEWIPSHTDIKGNDAADDQAKLASQVILSDSSSLNLTSFSFLKREGRSRVNPSWAQQFSSRKFKEGESVGLFRQIKDSLPSTTPSLQLQWPRSILTKLIQAQTGHGEFDLYHQKLNHPLADRTCPHCKDAKTSRSHPLMECESLIYYQMKYLKSSLTGEPLTLKEILDSKLGALCFKKFVKETNAYQRLQELVLPLPSSSSLDLSLSSNASISQSFSVSTVNQER